MIVENEFGSIDFDWEDGKDVCLSFSGGCDSTLLLYLSLVLLESKPNTIFHTFTGVTPAKGLWKQFTSQEIFDGIILEHGQHVKDRIAPRFVIYNDTQAEVGDMLKKMVNDGKFDIRMFGITSNPPLDIMSDHDLLFRREPKRDIENVKHVWFDNKATYAPLINVDKRFVAQCFKDFGLMKYYNLTTSCERLRETPDMQNNENPCGHCWWCREKKMAFEMLDGEYYA